jgi:hypothetical protein
MKEIFNLDCVTESFTILGYTCPDLMFARNDLAESVPYISYFSLHRQVLNRLHINVVYNTTLTFIHSNHTTQNEGNEGNELVTQGQCFRDH